jgi:2-iminobutanoate/2-iminopropanoate deaminase
MPREFIECSLFQPIGPYSHAVKSGNMIFVSGTPGVDPKTVELAGDTTYAQAAQAIRNVIDCVEAAGGTEADITSVQVNLVHVDDFTEMNRAYAAYFSEPFPARTVIGIAALPKPGARLTVNATAVLPSK